MKKGLNSFIPITIWIVFCLSCSFAQVDAGFIDHLNRNNLKEEHKKYLKVLPLSDSTFYFTAKFNLKYINDSLFLSNYSKSRVLSDADTLLQKQASAYFLMTANKYTPTWFNYVEGNKNERLTGFNTAYKASLNPKPYTKENFPEGLQKQFSDYKRAYNKKPLLAATFSMLLPGSGKLYAGKTKTFLLTFLLNAAYAAQTAESSRKLGYKHPLTVINAGAFTVFYLSNIYGSYRAVIELRKERKKQFITDAANFYN